MRGTFSAIEPKDESNVLTVGLMVLLGVAMLLIAAVAISALIRRRTRGQLDST